VIAADPEGHGRRRIVEANVGFLDVQIDRKAKTRRELHYTISAIKCFVRWRSFAEVVIPYGVSMLLQIGWGTRCQPLNGYRRVVYISLAVASYLESIPESLIRQGARKELA
jgi:hypothetical protein